MAVAMQSDRHARFRRAPADHLPTVLIDQTVPVDAAGMLQHRCGGF
jgi:hypothetical protein